MHIDHVEIKNVSLPNTIKRSMSRQAETERERRARIITADGELQASEKLAQATEMIAEHPTALQLQLLQTVIEVAAKKNSTLVLPFPVKLLQFLEQITPAAPPHADTPRSLNHPTDRVDGPILTPKPKVSAARLPEPNVPHTERSSLSFMPGQCG